ncbi:DUF1634 domain-containing protein [Sphingobacterium thalpophilum]|uniref:DUF1634 domain-containing protein n=1 Tax=Sphingobacterium thalpophilum TaxID=259 RepID=A0A4U9V523_9SPHI|nr:MULTISPECIES: DUF1634 domain-containing protein [Sphingobacterium]MCW8312816.1 DUF1634 domain-containing protein [Sphingobacterium sp. InxBP1]VTR41620.1 Predicted membrane protein [Sphingobacterium thalpophilum]
MKQVFSKHYWGDKDISLLVGQILRTGVILASSLLVISGVLYLIVHGQEQVPDYKDFIGESNANTTITGILTGAFAGSVPQLIQLGVLLLICTPIVRVIGSLFGFVIEKDRLYIIITLIVLAVIIGSILSGVKG